MMAETLALEHLREAQRQVGEHAENPRRLMDPELARMFALVNELIEKTFPPPIYHGTITKRL